MREVRHGQAHCLPRSLLRKWQGLTQGLRPRARGCRNDQSRSLVCGQEQSLESDRPGCQGQPCGSLCPYRTTAFSTLQNYWRWAVYTPGFHRPRSLGAHGSACLSSYSWTFGAPLRTERGFHYHPTGDDGETILLPSPHPPCNPPLSLWFYSLTARDLGRGLEHHSNR